MAWYLLRLHCSSCSDCQHSILPFVQLGNLTGRHQSPWPCSGAWGLFCSTRNISYKYMVKMHVVAGYHPQWNEQIDRMSRPLPSRADLNTVERVSFSYRVMICTPYYHRQRSHTRHSWLPSLQYARGNKRGRTTWCSNVTMVNYYIPDITEICLGTRVVTRHFLIVKPSGPARLDFW